MGACVCVHIFKGLWPIAPGHQTLFYQAWTHTKTDPLMSAAWVEIYMRTSLKHTHPFRDPRPRHERSTGYTSITLHNVPFTVAWITSRSFHVCRTKTHVASCELHAFLFYLVPAEIKRGISLCGDFPLPVNTLSLTEIFCLWRNTFMWYLLYWPSWVNFLLHAPHWEDQRSGSDAEPAAWSWLRIISKLKKDLQSHFQAIKCTCIHIKQFV